MLERLEALKGEFWTVRQELIEELEEMEFDIVEENAEYISVTTEAEEDIEYVIHLAGTERTIVVDYIEEVEI